jgi:hypothetical protein
MAGAEFSFRRRCNLTIKKTMTEQALLANHANAEKSTGPTNTEVTKLNAVKHGLLAKKLVFDTEEEKQEYESLLAERLEYHAPVGPDETMLVHEITISEFRLMKTYGWEFEELRNHRKAEEAILKEFRQHEDTREAPVLWAMELGWQPQAVLVRSGLRTHSEELYGTPEENHQSSVEARIASPMDKILRYQAAIKRDYYRALAALCQLQRDRLGL